MPRFLIVLGLLLASLQVACGDGDTSHPPGPGDGDADADADSDGDGDSDHEPYCYDLDEDGYGVGNDGGCLGLDCDDYDDSVWDDCSSCPAGLARESCPCFGTEDPVPCHSDELYEDEHGRLRCLTGLMYCEAQADPETFIWGDCVLDNP